MLPDSEYDRLRTLLLSATRDAFTEVQRNHSDETFYAFGLYHAPLWEYILPTANTEEGLIAKAHHYQSDPWGLGYASRSIESLATMLRWNPCDWAYHVEGEDFFKPVAEFLNDYHRYKWLGDIPDEVGNAQLDMLIARIIPLSRDILRTLDNEGLFGSGTVREHMVLNIMMGDQDASWIEHARLLNPPSVYQRWLSEIKAAGLY